MTERRRHKIGVWIFALLVLFVIYGVMFQKNGTKQEKEVWNLIDNINSGAVTIRGRVESQEYPYGYNVGVIEDAQVKSAVMVTPGTDIVISGTMLEDAALDVEYEIHPWVIDNSDGANLNITVTSEKESKEYVYEVSKKKRSQSISLKRFEGNDVKIKISVSNGKGKNENCDWVILNQFSISEGKFEENQELFSKGEYVKSATYFSDEWPINFWNSELENLENDFAQIKSDGFDSIILVIPWREFQIETNPVAYNDYAFQKLDKVMNTAQDAGLNVYARIGYTWDYYNDDEENIVDQFCQLMGDEVLQNAWYDYVKKMYVTLSSYENFKEAFLTWEDFWNNLGVCDVTDEKVRIEKAAFTGFQSWLEENYTLKEYNRKYDTEYTSYEEIPVPQRDEPAMESMYAYFDYFLNSILAESQKEFPNLSMEVRMDWDVIYLEDGTMEYFKHNATYSCMNSSFTTTMYGIPMGFENNGEQVGFREAMEKTEYILKQLKLENGGKPVYIDQFIFADNTPKFKNNAQIKENELNDYLESISSILVENSEGYGIWTYRNYCTNMLYNSQFALGGEEWNSNENAVFGKEEESFVCELEKGGSIQQNVPEIRNHFESEEYIFEFEVVNIKEPGRLVVSVGNIKQTIEIVEKGKVKLEFAKNDSFNVKIESEDCELAIDNLKLYSQVQQGYLYDENNNELQCIESIRVLNESLEGE